MKIAVVLFNLGGPSNDKEIKSFLFNLFSDPLIIRLPKIFRIPLAFLISTLRIKKAKKIYDLMDGKSPILENTFLQAGKLKEVLKKETDFEVETYVCMRYSSPTSKETIQKIKSFNPEKIVLLPLYPQFSTTTTKSSIQEFKKFFFEENLNTELKTICCYFDDENFITAHVELIKKEIMRLDTKNIKIIFSAHGIPESIIKGGDPYKYQIEKNVKLIMSQIENIEYVISYQSRVGPKEWTKPYTDEEIIRSSKDKKTIILVPIAFVSEHSETLVELDIDYKNLAYKNGATNYIRVKTLSTEPKFIKSLKNLVINSLNNDNEFYPKIKKCPKNYCGCIRDK